MEYNPPHTRRNMKKSIRKFCGWLHVVKTDFEEEVAEHDADGRYAQQITFHLREAIRLMEEWQNV